ncbi:MAG: ribose-5-phosphate isomerase RpiA [Planctomycetota bacterium]
MSDAKAAKRAAARAAADLVQSGMRIGLGSGSTFLFALERLAERIRDEKLDVAGVPTSSGTEQAARRLSIPLIGPDDVDTLDLAIDGADEIDPRRNLIKGGGGALVREKIVAASAHEMLVVADEGKLVEVLGKSFPLPIEILPFGRTQTIRRIEATGCEARLRTAESGEPFVSDNGNPIVDCRYEGIDDPAMLHDVLAAIPGVVESGLFVGMAGRVFVGSMDGEVRILD